MLRFCVESRYRRDLLLFSNPWAAGFPENRFPGETGGKKARGLQGRTTRAFTLRTCRASLGWGCCSWEARPLLRGAADPSAFTSASEQASEKRGRFGISQGERLLLRGQDWAVNWQGARKTS